MEKSAIITKDVLRKLYKNKRVDIADGPRREYDNIIFNKYTKIIQNIITLISKEKSLLADVSIPFLTKNIGQQFSFRWLFHC